MVSIIGFVKAWGYGKLLYGGCIPYGAYVWSFLLMPGLGPGSTGAALGLAAGLARNRSCQDKYHPIRWAIQATTTLRLAQDV